jgi:hypothetical protein
MEFNRCWASHHITWVLVYIVAEDDDDDELLQFFVGQKSVAIIPDFNLS